MYSIQISYWKCEQNIAMDKYEEITSPKRYNVNTIRQKYNKYSTKQEQKRAGAKATMFSLKNNTKVETVRNLNATVND